MLLIHIFYVKLRLIILQREYVLMAPTQLKREKYAQLMLTVLPIQLGSMRLVHVDGLRLVQSTAIY